MLIENESQQCYMAVILKLQIFINPNPIFHLDLH